MFGETAALNVLDEGEDHGCKQYEDPFTEYSPEFRHFVQHELAAPQRMTHDILSAKTSK